MNRAWCFALLLANVAAAAPLQSMPAAPPAARDLVTTPVDVAHSVELIDHRARWAVSQNRAEPVPDELPMEHLVLELNRSAEREQAFQQLLQDQQNPASPQFHRWLTPIDIGLRYGASAHDIDAVVQWLSAQGMRDVHVANSRTRIQFSASAGRIAAAFGTRLHYYNYGAEKRIANTDVPRIPAALAPLVRAVRGLATERHRPQLVSRPRVQRSTDASQPALTNCSGGSCEYAVFPGDFATIFNTKPLLAQGTNGSGQKIGIIGKSRVNAADLTNFMQLAAVTFAQPNVIIPPAGVDPGPAATTCSTSGTNTCTNPSDQVMNQSEATLDISRAASVAPGATIELIVSKDTVTSDGTDIATEYAVDTSPVPAPILSISFGSCEAQNGASVTHEVDALYQQAAAEGISIMVASGDGGAAECDTPFKTPPAVQVLSINVLCASGSATCVGGTEFADQANPTAYWSSTNGTGFESALGYIPEGAWNDPLDSAGKTQAAASGGGVSDFITTPSWQTGPGVPGTFGRYTPDVSFPASTREGYFFCIAAEGESCVADSQGSITFAVGGGTSASTPSMAGLAALLNQNRGGPQGNLNPRLYALGAHASNGVFHDVTVASSSVTNCSTSIPSLCNNSLPGPTGLSGGLAGYAVGAGYDLATGWGSIDAAKLLANWSASATIALGGYMSGAWYHPGQAGHGFDLELTTAPGSTATTKTMVAFWYVYTPDGSAQNWVYAQGDYDPTASTVTLPATLYTGGRFPPNFNQADVTSLPYPPGWGTLTFTFSDCNNGTVSWHSDLPGYNLDNDAPLTITRLTQIAGTACP
jgi:subtilase family serine protease